MSTQRLRVEFPRAFAPLLQPARYKGAYGGRGSGKSHFFGEQIILRCYRQTTRVACIREVQNSLKESVKQLLVDKIQKLGLGQFFEVLESEIRGKNGSLIIFRGMQSYNAETIKSLEGYDIAWVEEAQSLSDVSLRMLRPTIRKDNSELWFSWNPRHDTDAVDKLLRSAVPPDDAIVVEVNWHDNPWFPEVLKAEKDRDYIVDPEMAEHVWGGGYQLVSEGAFYAKWLADAEKQGRIGDFPYRPAFPVITSWDLGMHDYTAIWFFQTDGVSATAVDYYEVSGSGFDDIVAICMPELFKAPPEDFKFDGWTLKRSLEILGRDPPFRYSHHFLPHDVRVKELAAGGRSRVESLIRLGVQNIRKGVPAKNEDRIEAVRRLLPIMKFNKTPRVELGLKRLRRYRRKWNDALQTYTDALHDENSHGADAFGEFAINCGISPPKEPPKPKPINVRLPTLNEMVAYHDRHAAGGKTKRI